MLTYPALRGIQYEVTSYMRTVELGVMKLKRKASTKTTQQPIRGTDNLNLIKQRTIMTR